MVSLMIVAASFEARLLGGIGALLAGAFRLRRELAGVLAALAALLTALDRTAAAVGQLFG